MDITSANGLLLKAEEMPAIAGLSLGLWFGLQQFQTRLQGPPPLQSATALKLQTAWIGGFSKPLGISTC